MDLLQLQYFRTVASLEHMTKASEALHVSQPSLSRTIGNLEKELGVELFYRTGRKITLNQYGKTFLRHVNRALDSLQAGCDELAAMQQNLQPIIVSSPNTGMITEMIASYHVLYPNVPITFRIDPFDKIPAVLEKKEVDFVICDIIAPGAKTEDWIPVSEERLYAMLSKRDPLAEKEHLYLNQLRDYKLALPESASPIRAVLNYFFQINNMSLRSAYEINDIYSQLHLVDKGSAISLIPMTALYDIISKQDNIGFHAIEQVRIIPIEDSNIVWQLALSPLSGRTEGAAAQRFYQHCIDSFAGKRGKIRETVDAFCKRTRE